MKWRRYYDSKFFIGQDVTYRIANPSGLEDIVNSPATVVGVHFTASKVSYDLLIENKVEYKVPEEYVTTEQIDPAPPPSTARIPADDILF